MASKEKKHFCPSRKTQKGKPSQRLERARGLGYAADNSYLIFPLAIVNCEIQKPHRGTLYEGNDQLLSLRTVSCFQMTLGKCRLFSLRLTDKQISPGKGLQNSRLHSRFHMVEFKYRLIICLHFRHRSEKLLLQS